MFYVYVYRDPRPEKNAQPVYVGKGCGKRSHKHWLQGNTRNKPFNDWLTKMRSLKTPPIIQVVAEFDDESSAFKKEIELIGAYGRRDLKTGPLFNITDGGEGFAGIIRTEAWCQNISAALSTPEHVARQSRIALERWSDPVYRKTQTAKLRAAIADPVISARREAAKAISHHTPEFREKMRVVGKGFWDDPDYRERTVASMTAAQSRPDVSARKSEMIKAGWANPETRQKRIAGIRASRTPELRAQLSASCKALWTDDKKAGQSAKMKAVLASPDMKAQRAAAMRARWADPEYRARVTAKLRKPHAKPAVVEAPKTELDLAARRWLDPSFKA